MFYYLKIWLFGLVVFLAVDMLWLGLIANEFYKKELSDLVRKTGDSLSPQWIPAIILYMLMVAGAVMFVLPKAQASSYDTAFLWGAAFGFIAYAVYDLTNLAVLNNWSLKVTIVDMIWGAILFGIVTMALKWFASVIG